MLHRSAAAALAVALLLSGCGGTPEVPEVAGVDNGTSARTDEGKMVNCGGSTYDPTVLADAPAASSLPAGPAGATDDAGSRAFDPSEDWRVVHQSEDRVDLVRKLDEPFDNGGGDIRSHESRTLERITGATNVPDGTWLLTSAGPCTQRLATTGNLGEADLTLPRPPEPDSSTLDLFVHERACASGQNAEGRIELVSIEETTDQVRLHIGVSPRGGGQDCQGNPPTPFTVELSEPLGDRQVVDASVVPARPVTAPNSP